MKAFKIVAKILVALAAVAGAVYVAATYGDKIVAWCKDMLARLNGGCCCKCTCECTIEDTCDECSEEVTEEETPAEEAAADETAVAEEVDFEA